MSMDDYENCLRGQYNMDAEAVKFIIQIYQLGGEEALHIIKENWEKIAAASAIITAIAKIGGQSAVVKFFQSLLGRLGGALVDVLAAFVLGFGLAAVLLAITAGVECLPKISQ
jgi:hypothetical protein